VWQEVIAFHYRYKLGIDGFTIYKKIMPKVGNLLLTGRQQTLPLSLFAFETFISGHGQSSLV
jgi:hypothetical protein